MGGVVGRRQDRKRKKKEALSLSRRNLGSICIIRGDHYSLVNERDSQEKEKKREEEMIDVVPEHKN